MVRNKWQSLFTCSHAVRYASAVLAMCMPAGCTELINAYQSQFYLPDTTCHIIPIAEIIVEGPDELSPPDQVSGSCNSVRISRSFVDNFQHQLIIEAERRGATGQSDWFDSGQSISNVTREGDNLLVPFYIGKDSLTYYVSRSRELESMFSVLGRGSTLDYNALVKGPLASTEINGIMFENAYVIEISLSYIEYWNAIRTSGYGVEANRTVVFDNSGNVLMIFGDGSAKVAIIG